MKRSAAGLWQDPSFLKLWTAQTVSKFGSHIGGVALEFTAILLLAATPFQVGLLAALRAVPVLVIGLLAGVWVDRTRRRPILIVADIGRAMLLLSVPAAALVGLLSIGQLYVVAVSVGVLTVFFDVADQSFSPTLLGREQLVERNTKLGIGGSLAEIAGPAAGGGRVQMTVYPRQVRVGQIVTVSGQTRGFVQFLPPFVLMQSAHRHTVHLRGLGCGPTTVQPLAYAAVVKGGGSGGAGSRQNPPVGTAWTVRFRLPERMNRTTKDGRQATIHTSTGLYYLSAVEVGIDFCTLPTTSDQTVSVGTVTVVR